MNAYRSLVPDIEEAAALFVGTADIDQNNIEFIFIGSGERVEKVLPFYSR